MVRQSVVLSWVYLLFGVLLFSPPVLLGSGVVAYDYDMGFTAWLGLVPGVAFALFGALRLSGRTLSLARAFIAALALCCAANLALASPSFAATAGGLVALASGLLAGLFDGVDIVSEIAMDALLAGLVTIVGISLLITPSREVGAGTTARIEKTRKTAARRLPAVKVTPVGARMPKRSSLRIATNSGRLAKSLEKIGEQVTASGSSSYAFGNAFSGPYLDVVELEANDLDVAVLQQRLAESIGAGALVLRLGPRSFQIHIPAQRRGVVPIRQVLDGLADTRQKVCIALGLSAEGEAFSVDLSRHGSLLGVFRSTEEMEKVALTIGLAASLEEEPPYFVEIFTSPPFNDDPSIRALSDRLSIAVGPKGRLSQMDGLEELDRRTQERATARADTFSPIIVPFVILEHSDALLTTLFHVTRYGPDVAIYPLVFSLPQFSPNPDGFGARCLTKDAAREIPESALLFDENDYLFMTRYEKIRYHGPDFALQELTLVRDAIANHHVDSALKRARNLICLR